MYKKLNGCNSHNKKGRGRRGNRRFPYLLIYSIYIRYILYMLSRWFCCFYKRNTLESEKVALYHNHCNSQSNNGISCYIKKFSVHFKKPTRI